MTSLAEPSANGVVASNWRIGVHVTVLPATSSTEPLTTSGGNAVSSMTGHSESLHGCEPRERPEPETDGRARKVALSAFQSCNEIRALVFITPGVVRAWNSRSTASNRNVPQSGSTGVARADQSVIGVRVGVGCPCCAWAQIIRGRSRPPPPRQLAGLLCPRRELRGIEFLAFVDMEVASVLVLALDGRKWFQ